MSNLDDDKLCVEKYDPSQNVAIWLHRLNTERVLRNWSDAVALAYASLFMGDVALMWFLNNCDMNTAWATFDQLNEKAIWRC